MKKAKQKGEERLERIDKIKKAKKKEVKGTLNIKKDEIEIKEV